MRETEGEEYLLTLEVQSCMSCRVGTPVTEFNKNFQKEKCPYCRGNKKIVRLRKVFAFKKKDWEVNCIYFVLGILTYILSIIRVSLFYLSSQIENLGQIKFFILMVDKRFLVDFSKNSFKKEFGAGYREKSRLPVSENHVYVSLLQIKPFNLVFFVKCSSFNKQTERFPHNLFCLSLSLLL